MDPVARQNTAASVIGWHLDEVHQPRSSAAGDRSRPAGRQKALLLVPGLGEGEDDGPEGLGESGGPVERQGREHDAAARAQPRVELLRKGLGANGKKEI